MDEDISNWILEFLLRQPLDEKLINGVLSSLPLKDRDNRLKKTLLLRKIKYEAADGSVSEKLLDYLEIIEEIDHGEGKSASDSMKAAYCAVAVDCTVRFLDEDVRNNARYVEAVERVWRGRVCKIEGLSSEELKRKMGEIEAAVWDSDACGKLLRINTRHEALKSVRVYLAEAWGSLGPSFLELVAEKVGTTLEALRGGSSSGGGAASSANPPRESPANGETRKVQAPVRRKHIAVKSKRGKGAKISNEGNEDESMGKADDVPAPEVEAVPPPIKSSSMELHAAKKVNVPSALQTAQNLPSTKATDNMNKEPVVENHTLPGMCLTPEVNRIREALKSSSMELHAAVKDPLPEALQIAKNLSSTMATDKGSSEPVVVKQTGPELPQPRGCSDNPTENADKENPNQCSPGNGGQHQMGLRNRKRTLMEPNGTAQTFEWDDSIDNSAGGSSKRPHLPSPKESKPSPVKSYQEDTRFDRRKARKKWTPLEEDTLRVAVQKFGRGNWKFIWHTYRDIFQGRTDGDLKDKWRNMTERRKPT